MRKGQKKQIQEIMESLNEAHEEIQKLLKQREYKTAQAVLADCQQCAIEVGNAIEESEGENCEAVKKIETYCEAVFLLYNQIETIGVLEEGNSDTENTTTLDMMHKEVQQELKGVSSEIDEIVVRKEVVFFPYKASMWDSLESIYLAAKEDENCDAYCVPIPYYDRNPDRSLGQMHYEGNEYPKNIEVIDWQTYNFEERKPDEIYIHNPYDDWNFVTCVHPRYFSANLKKYTEKLVYIPYFVLGEIEPDDQEAIDKMKHFVWTSGVINADKVIVQSEKMKQIYVNEYLKAAQVNGLQGKHIDRKYLEEKFMGLGSPKFDKVLNTKKEDLEIPEEWLKVIEKPDGSWKKIIFYNTSIAALLENNEIMLEKMKDVFRIFKENKEEIVLLWRPHPLIKTTISAMRPQLWKEYEKLVNRYKEEGWGIYDDTSDMDRAVVLSDGYYGDMSSVVLVYQKTGKPVMLQNIKTNAKSDNVHYLLNSWCKDAGNTYFIPHNLNALVKYSEEKQRSEWILPILNADQKKSALYSDIKKYKNKLFFIPLHDTKIVTYDLNAKNFECISIPSSEHWNCAWGNFSKAYRYGQNLYLVGYRYPGIVRLNMETCVCEQVLDVYSLHSRNAEKQSIAIESIEKNEEIYILLPNTDELVKYDMKCNESAVYHLKNGNTGKYQTIAYDGDNFWLTSNGIEYLKWNEEKQQGETFVHPEQEKIVRDNLYRYSLFSEGKLYVLSSKEAPIVVVDCNDFKHSRLIWKDKVQRKGYCADYLYKNGQECTFIDLENESNKLLNARTGEIVETKRMKDKEKIVQMLISYNGNTAIKEGGASLIEFINMLKKVNPIAE